MNDQASHGPGETTVAWRQSKLVTTGAGQPAALCESAMGGACTATYMLTERAT